jgi:hypothetical protein
MCKSKKFNSLLPQYYKTCLSWIHVTTCPVWNICSFECIVLGALHTQSNQGTRRRRREDKIFNALSICSYKPSFFLVLPVYFSGTCSLLVAIQHKPHMILFIQNCLCEHRLPLLCLNKKIVLYPMISSYQIFLLLAAEVWRSP